MTMNMKIDVKENEKTLILNTLSEYKNIMVRLCIGNKENRKSYFIKINKDGTYRLYKSVVENNFVKSFNTEERCKEKKFNKFIDEIILELSNYNVQEVRTYKNYINFMIKENKNDLDKKM